MNAAKHLQQAIQDYELANQKAPTVLRATYDVIAELDRNNALPDNMEIQNVDAPYRVLRVE